MVSQSTIIAGFLMLAFLVYITTKGQLPAYLYVLGISPGVNNVAGSNMTGAVGLTATNVISPLAFGP
jgi:hypothetical protein